MHIVDISIIIAFLIATLYIGFSSGKKIKTFSDYAIGNRKFSDFAIFCTVAATAIGGTTTMGNVGKFYDIGITQILAQIGFPIAYIIIGVFLVHRFSNFYGCCSLGDMFYKSYGITGKLLAGVVGCTYEMLAVGLQFMAMGTTINVLTGFSYVTSLLISVGVLLIYTGRGGVRAVTFTDVLQFMVLILAIPILLIVILGKIGGIQALMDQLPKSHITISGENFRRYLFLMFPLMIPMLSPHHTQRLLMTSNHIQGAKAYRNLGLTFLFVVIIAAFLGLGARVLFPNLNRCDQALFTLITNCLPVGIFGIVIIGILAVLMSSADSILNCGSIALINDVILPFTKKEITETSKLKLVRVATILMGIGAVIFASQCTGIFETRILVNTVWISVILSPLYFLIFNMKIPLKGLFISAVVGFSTATLWSTYIKPITKIDGLFPGFFANVITVLFFYFLGGRQKVFSKEELEKMRRAEVIQTKKRLSVRDLQMRNNTILGLCLVFLQLMPLVFNANSLTYSKLLLTLINGTMAILLIFSGSLELFEKEKRFQWLKLTTLFFCLPVTSAYQVVTSTENGLSLITLVLSFVVMFLSVKREQVNKLIFTCGFIALITFISYLKADREMNWLYFLSWHHLFYLLGFLAVLLLIHSNLHMLQQEKEQEKYRERYNMARSLSHDLMSPLMALHLLSSQKKLNEFDEKECQLHQNIISEMENYINDFIVGGLKDQSQLRLEDLNQCVLSCIEKQTILNKNLEIQLNAKETVFARVDAVLLRRIINNLVNVCRHALPNNCKTIVIAIGNDPLGNTQILLQAANDGFSAKALNSMFIEDQKLGDEIELGISFPEFQDIVSKWHGKLELITHGDNAIIQILLPSKDHDKLIQKA
ncbi:MAG: sodium:solute symporter family transporter [Opitutales bacterium]